MTNRSDPKRLLGLPAWLTLPLAGACTAFIWLEQIGAAPSLPEPLLLSGLCAGVCACLLVQGAARNAGNARDLRHRLGLAQRQRSLVSNSDRAESVRPDRALWWASIVLGLIGPVAAGILRFEPMASEWAQRADGPVQVKFGLTALIWIAALTALLTGARRRSLAIALHGALGGARLLEESLESFPVMVSVLLPDGTRSHFNARFREVTGRDDSQLLGHAWLDCVHASDRALFEQLGAPLLESGPSVRELEYGLACTNGANRWIRERFVPQRDDNDSLLGYVAVGVDITAQVEQDSKRADELARANGELERLRDEAGSAEAQVAGLKSELTSASRSRDRYKQVAEDAKQKASAASERLEEAELETVQANAKERVARDDLRKSRAEVTKLNRKLARIESDSEALRLTLQEKEEQAEEAERRVASALADAAADRDAASQLRLKVRRLTEQNQDLGRDLEAERAEHAGAVDALHDNENQIHERSHERARSLAHAMRPQCGGLRDLVDRIRLSGLDELQLDALDSVRASLDSMIVLLEGEGGLPGDEADRSPSGSARAFDMRAAVQQTIDLLEPVAQANDIELSASIDPSFPTQVCADSARIREVLLLLAAHTLHAGRGGTCNVSLSSEGTSDSQAALRLQIERTGCAEEAGDLHTLFALTDEAEASPAGGARRAARAWALLREMSGEFGLEQADPETFSVWLSLNLSRRSRPGLETSTAPPAPVSSEPEAGASETARESGPVSMLTPAINSDGQGIDSGIRVPSARPTRSGPPRLPQELHKCNLGEVLELGPRGARVRTGKHLKGSVTLRLVSAENERVEIDANVASCEKKSGRQHEAMLEFQGVDPQTHRTILEIAMAYRPLTMRPLSDD